MVRVRMDRRLMARVDPSDVVQETLTDAAQGLDDYLQRRPLPFYSWLRQFAWDRLVAMHRRHIGAVKRSIAREQRGAVPLPDESVVELAQRIVASNTSPSRRAIRHELRDRVHVALEELGPRDREILVMRHLEQMETAEIAAVLGITEGAVRVRHVRALERLRASLDVNSQEEAP
jgi:RNA polymerase sigma-70 factor (ECF subfamily)